MAMALFAHIAAPQVRLTKDPNTFFFFLDHLAQESPFRLEDDTTLGHEHRARHRVGHAADREGHRAVRQVAEREGVRARDRRPGVERRSGARAQNGAHQRRPVYVVGVGTTVGAFIPEPERKPNDTSPREPPIRAALDRGSLMQIANAGGGEYLELDREGDREISNRIIDAARKRAGSRGLEVANEELYWRFLLAAAAFVTLGLLFLQEKAELWLAGRRRRRRAHAGLDADTIRRNRGADNPLHERRD